MRHTRPKAVKGSRAGAAKLVNRVPVKAETVKDLELKIEAAKIVRLERRLYHFAQEAWQYVPGAGAYVDNWHIELVCDHIQAVIEGRIENILFNLPPGVGKSILEAVISPAWVWANYPNKCMLFISYGEDLSIRDSVRCRRLIESTWYRKRWGNRVRLVHDQNAKKKYETTAGGWRMATSVDGAATGEHPDLIFGDDLHKALEDGSVSNMQRAIDFWDGTIGTRGMSRGSRRILSGQRIAEHDISSHAIKSGEYELVVLPMRYEPGLMKPTSIGGEDRRSVPGELLFPQILGEPAVKKMELRLRHRAAAQLGQNPRASTGDVFRASDFRYFRTVPLAEIGVDPQAGWPDCILELLDPAGPRRYFPWECSWFQTCDTAMKTGQENDYTVVGTFVATPGGDLLVFHVTRERLSVPKQFPFLVAQRTRFPCLEFQGIEDAASGIGLIQHGLSAGLPFRALKAVTDKVSRSAAVATLYSGGKVYHHAGQAWLTDYEDELVAFPGKHDDQVDVTSYAGQIAVERAMKRMGVHEIDPEEVPTVDELLRQSGLA